MESWRKGSISAGAWAGIPGLQLTGILLLGHNAPLFCAQVYSEDKFINLLHRAVRIVHQGRPTHTSGAQTITALGFFFFLVRSGHCFTVSKMSIEA